MDKTFFEGMPLEEAQVESILNAVQKEVLCARLSASGVRSLTAAESVVAEQYGDLHPEEAIAKLKQEHGYLFEEEKPQFTGPAGGDKEEEDALRKALGLL
ncbi:MAG: hypothetical protein IKJ55_05160 [Clostridia bacterium]|nr:hypothetical protein [Clostridia bacterium]